MRIDNIFHGWNTWFTADTHFYDKNIIRRGYRPFDTVEEMNSELVRRWNETVPESGIVFHLGDFSQGGCREWRTILSKLHGHIYLIRGNHDNLTKRMMVYNKTFVRVLPQMNILIDGQKIILNHYPFLFYCGELDNVWQLFGHIHSGPNEKHGFDLPRLNLLFPFQYDVGVDNNGFRPVSFQEVKEKISSQVDAAQLGTERGGILLNEGIPTAVSESDLREAVEAYSAADRILRDSFCMNTLNGKESAGDRLYHLTCALLERGLLLDGRGL